MNVLLLLSALLSALTGVTGAARVGAPAEQVAIARVTVATAQVVAPRTVHVVGQAPAWLASQQAQVPVVRLPVAAPRLYADRRRE